MFHEIQLLVLFLFHLHIYKGNRIVFVGLKAVSNSGRNMHIIYYGPGLSDIIVSDNTSDDHNQQQDCLLYLGKGN